MATTTDLTTLKINYLTQAQYDAALSGGTINENELYLTPDATPQPSSSTPASVSGSAAGSGSATTYSRSDHIHLIDSTAVTDALGYTPYHSFGSWTTINRSTMTSGWSATGDGFLTISGTAASGKTPYVYIQTTESGTTYNVATYNCASGGRLGMTFPVKSGWTYTMLYDTSSGAWTTTPVTRFMPLE